MVLRILFWPFRALARTLSRPFRAASRGGRAGARMGKGAGEGAAAGATGGPLSTASAAAPSSFDADLEEVLDVRPSVFFKCFSCPRLQEQATIELSLDAAKRLAANAAEFYKHRFPLFPRDDVFYEDVESQYIREALQIEKGGVDELFFTAIKQAREITNDNTRALFLVITPLIFAAFTGLFAYVLFADPFGFLRPQPPLQLGGLSIAVPGLPELALGGAAIAAALAVILFVYRFSYTHIQRENALSLDNFITTKFARITNLFRVAQRESLQAEAQLTESQKDLLKELASSWALSYHWLSIRQLFLELLVRNNLFQIRRNTALYYLGGVLICLLILALAAMAVGIAAGGAEPRMSAISIIAHVTGAGLAFLILAFGLAMRDPFRIIVPVLRAKEWNRYNTLGLGDAIVEQVSRDKMSIVLLRDRMRSGGG